MDPGDLRKCIWPLACWGKFLSDARGVKSQSHGLESSSDHASVFALRDSLASLERAVAQGRGHEHVVSNDSFFTRGGGAP